MRLKIRSFSDVFIGLSLGIFTTFGLPLLSYVFINPVFTFNILLTTLSGYMAWIALWFIVWVVVDGIFDRVSIKFVIDSIKYISRKL